MKSVRWCIAWLGGCALGLLVLGSPNNAPGIEPLYGQILFLIGAALVLPLAVAWHERRVRLACLLAMSALGGCSTALLIHPPAAPGDLAYYNVRAEAQSNARKIVVTGEITGEPVLADRSKRFRFAARQIRLPGQALPQFVTGNLFVTAPRYPEYILGTELSLSGVMTSPPRLSEFDYPAYLARQNIYSYMSFPVVRDLGAADTGFLGILLTNGRERIKAALQQGIPEPQAALAVGVVMGDRSGMSKGVQSAFTQSGTTQIIAISGQNIALVTGVIWLIFGANQKRRLSGVAFTAAVAAIVIYTLFTGAAPSAVRAAVMGSILLFAPIARRRYDPVAALAITATGMSILDPDVLADAGFQLSFAAMLGIALLAPPLYTLTEKLRIPRFLGLPIAVSIAAQATTAPLIALISGQVSLVALPANLIANLGLLPLMITGIAAGIVGAIFPPLSPIVGVIVWPAATWILACAQLWSALPGASLDMSTLNPLWVVAYYAMLAACIWLIFQGKRHPLKLPDYATAAGSALALLLWSALASFLFS